MAARPLSFSASGRWKRRTQAHQGTSLVSNTTCLFRGKALEKGGGGRLKHAESGGACAVPCGCHCHRGRPALGAGGRRVAGARECVVVVEWRERVGRGGHAPAPR